MRTIQILFFIVAGLGPWLLPESAGCASQDPLIASTGDPYLDDLRYLSRILRESWAWLEMREQQGLDLEALEKEAIELAKKEPGDRGFLRGLTRYVAGISDGHASVVLDGVDLREERIWPFSLVEVEEGLMVDGIGPGIFRSKALKRGDIVLAIDGKPIDGVIRTQEDFVFASSPAARRRKAIFALTESTDRESYRVLVLPMGGTEPITVEVACPPPSEPVPRYSWRAIEEKCEELDAKTAYLRVTSFSPKDPSFAGAPPEDRDQILASQYDAYALAFEKICTKSTLILDLRGNPGGTDLLGQALALHLLEPGFRYYRLGSKREGRWVETPYYKPVIGRGTPRFDGRLLCLIDEKTNSAADNLAACLRDEHSNVLFIGQPTGAGSGAPRPFTLPATKARVHFCTMRVWAPNGTLVEGNGVQPDIFVRPSRAQVLAGEDAAMEAALLELRQ